MSSTSRNVAAPGGSSLTDMFWLVGLLLLVFLLGAFDLSNGDIWVHLRAGQLIWQRGEVPQADWFTFADYDAVWIDLNWGFQLACAALFALGGVAALIMAKAALGTAAVAIGLLAGRSDSPLWLVVACWLAPVLVFSSRYNVRPEIVTLLLLAALLAVLYHAPPRPRLIWLLPVIQLVWVNTHGLFILEHIILVLFLLDRALRQWWTWGAASEELESSFPWWKWLAAALLTCGASLVNPYGVRGALEPLNLWDVTRGARRELCLQFSGELRGLDMMLSEYGLASLTSVHVLLFLLVLGTGILTFLLLLRQGRLPLFRLLLFMIFAYLTWRMVRNGVMFGIVAGVVIRLNVDDLVELARESMEPSQQRRELGSALVRTSVALCLGLLIVVLPSGVLPKRDPGAWPRKLGLGQAPWFGHAAARFLQQPGMPDYIYAIHEGQAAVCIYHLAPQKRVFVDGRIHIFQPESLQRCLLIQQQLATGDGAVIENLTRSIPAQAVGQRPVPALLFDNETLLSDSFHEPRLLHNIMASKRWRCVFCDTKQTGQSADLSQIIYGTTVFLPEDVAQQLDLPEADIGLLLWAADVGERMTPPDFRSRTPLDAPAGAPPEGGGSGS